MFLCNRAHTYTEAFEWCIYAHIRLKKPGEKNDVILLHSSLAELYEPGL